MCMHGWPHPAGGGEGHGAGLHRRQRDGVGFQPRVDHSPIHPQGGDWEDPFDQRKHEPNTGRILKVELHPVLGVHVSVIVTWRHALNCFAASGTPIDGALG